MPSLSGQRAEPFASWTHNQPAFAAFTSRMLSPQMQSIRTHHSIGRNGVEGRNSQDVDIPVAFSWPSTKH